MDLLYTHLRKRLFQDPDANERVFIKDNTLYEHLLLTIDYTTYDLKRDQDAIHLNFGNQAVMVYSPTSQDPEPWLYAYVIAIYHLSIFTPSDTEPERLELLWVRWMERDSSQLQGPNSSRYTRVSFTPDSGIPSEAFGFVDPSHVIRGCHLIPAFELQQTRNQLGPSITRDAKGDWRAFYANRYDPACHGIYHLSLTSHNRFADRDAFARFSGIGIGCQQMQATRTLEIVIGPDAPDPAEPAANEFDESLFEGCYTISDDESDTEL